MFEEKIIIGKNTKYPLNGILTLPNKINNPVPAVVLVHGSGASNMDEKERRRRFAANTSQDGLAPQPGTDART